MQLQRRFFMQKRILGRTGLEVSVISFGAMTIGGAFGAVDDKESIRALHTAVDKGINFIDTSDAYGAGHSEEVIGKFIKERADREQILICTKGGNNMVLRQLNFTPEYIQNCVESSLKRLGVEAFDLYLLHNPKVENINNGDSFNLLDDFVAQGKIKHWGVSLNTVEECEVAVANGRLAVFQMEYNLLGRDAEAAFKKAKSADVGVVSRVPLKRGFLTGRFPVEHQFADGDVRSRVLTQENMIRFQEKLDKLTEISKQTGISTTEQAIRFCVSNPDVTTVTMGIRTPQQAEQNAACSQALPADVMDKLKVI
jgi:aryl-alcohol dehydrogenase-like predicted oxidoreductase